MFGKKFLVFIFSIIGFWTISNNVSAVTIAECEYNTTTLLLPVTIGAEVTGINMFYPFDRYKDVSYEVQLYVHDGATCASTLSVPENDKYYMYGYSYYYIYNNTKYYVDFIGQGTYRESDLTPPTITSLLGDTVDVNVDKKIELDDILGFINVTDNRDTKIIPEVTFDNYSENYNKVGIYSIIYQACDSSNNCSKYTLKLNVIDTTPPIISGETNFNSYMSNPISLIDISKNLTAIDNHDGDISSKIFISSSNYRYDKLGSYYVYFSVIDNSNNQIQNDFKVTINVFDDISPSIEGPTYFKSYLSSPLQVADILSQLTMSDNVDSNCYKNAYYISDNYSTNMNKLGKYNLVIGTYDSSGNESDPYKIEIEVLDDVAPIITGTSLYETYLSSPLNLLEIKSSLIVYDNYDNNISNKLETIEDNYSINKNTIGVYYINFIVQDSSENYSLPFLVEIHVYDDIAPMLDGKNIYNSLTSEKIDVMTIKFSLSATDNVDGDISDKIVVNDDFYSENFHIEGEYFLTFYASDRSGNISNMYRVKIIVSENLSYLESINNSHLYFTTSNHVKDEEIFEILSINSNDYLSVTTLENTYSHSYNIPGSYKIIYQLENQDYSTYTLSINVMTKEEKNHIENNQKTIKENKKETIFSKIISFLSNIFANIGTFFKGLFD